MPGRLRSIFAAGISRLRPSVVALAEGSANVAVKWLGGASGVGTDRYGKVAAIAPGGPKNKRLVRVKGGFD